MKIKRHFLIYATHATLCIALTIHVWASSSPINRGFGATLVCPFSVTNGPKAVGNVVVACFTDTGCNTLIGNYSWGGRGGTPILQNGSHTLSNDAMTAASLTTACGSAQSIQLQVHNPGNTAFSLLCMPAIVSSGTFTCSGGPYTLNINNL